MNEYVDAPVCIVLVAVFSCCSWFCMHESIRVVCVCVRASCAVVLRCVVNGSAAACLIMNPTDDYVVLFV
jgi:hypothetical protein